MLSLFTVRALTADVNIIFAASDFIRNTFFGGEAREVYSTTKYVDIVVKKGSKKLAPFVSPKLQGTVMKSEGRKLDVYEPPLLKPKFLSEADAVFEANTVAHANSETPEQRAASTLANELLENKNGIFRSIEKMATDALLDGKIIVKGEGVEEEIDFQRDPSNTKLLTGAALWTNDGSDPLADLDKWSDEVYLKSGKRPTTVVFGGDVATAFLAHEKVQKAFDVKDIKLGELDPEPKEDGVDWIGKYQRKGLEIYAYIDGYDDENGVAKEYLPKDRFIMGSKNTAAHIAFAGIADKRVKEYIPDANIFAGQIFAKAWEVEDPSAIHVLLQSKPLPLPVEVDAFMSAKVV